MNTTTDTPTEITEDMERYQCAECGHLHWVEAAKAYDDCPICDCEGQS